jgi:hypothetical protein
MIGLRIESLPDNLHVNGKLDATYTIFTTIPNNLYVGEYINLTDSKLTKYYNQEQINKMIEDKGGQVNGKIFI